MRFTSFLGIAATATFAALAFIGSPANAVAVPPSSFQPADIGSSSPESVSNKEEIFKAFTSLLKLEPRIAIVQPKGVGLTHVVNDRGLIETISGTTVNKELYKILVTYKENSEQISSFSIKVYGPENKDDQNDVPIDVAVVAIKYDSNTGNARAYDVITSQGYLMTEAREGYFKAILNSPTLGSYHELNIQPWDGKHIERLLV
ncbi:hypothetical protein THASP1DRAFT_30073 [Thamnocephalis sphaerospora]|uniref:Uncharacterized protein n=1 Tax=Thamnocephalis sphaerospora TaxID=78915 RepID=A0A4P9XS06_9FUNG|nr:hypothetical protein THASP1DRAFT_30073 [Thamnocephalis sphaerospora]|eukprot:RKP08120.1 hypothetical protein THASP1DRAFT_30073 [Thamnocephalis sphaerospora]